MAKKPTTRKSRPQRHLSLVSVCSGLLKLSPQVVDEDALKLMFGGATFPTIPAIATAFGVRPQTVYQSWRQGGMPGKPYRAWQIAGWWIERNRREASRDDKAADPHRARVREIELRTAELDLRKRERDDAAAENRLIDRHDAVASICALIAVTRDYLMRIPADIAPMVSADQARVLVPEVERLIEHRLLYLAEKSGREMNVEAWLFRQLLDERQLLRAKENGEAKAAG